MTLDAPPTLPSVPPPIAIVIDHVQLESELEPVSVNGSLLVPARAIFIALGADVTYNASTGHMIAVRGKRIVSLTIGSTGASVAGHAITLPIAPRVVDRNTYVPLRFITEAFGGVAKYNAAAGIVTIDGASATPTARDPQALGTPEAYAGLTIVARHPEPGETVSIALPAISGVFQTHGGPDIDPDSVRYTIDGVDETAIVQISGPHFGLTPSQPLAPGQHDIDINGLDRSATPFDVHWTFLVAENATYQPATMTLQTADDLTDDDTVGFDEESGGAFTLVGPYAPGSGDPLHFEFAGPPGGTGYVSLCGYAPQYPMYYDPATLRYIANVPLPPNLYAPSCYVTGTWVSAGGTTHTMPLSSPIPIDTTGARGVPGEPRRAPSSPGESLPADPPSFANAAPSGATLLSTPGVYAAGGPGPRMPLPVSSTAVTNATPATTVTSATLVNPVVRRAPVESVPAPAVRHFSAPPPSQRRSSNH